MGTYFGVMVLVVVLAQFAQPVAARSTSSVLTPGSPDDGEVVKVRRFGNHVFALLAASVLIGFAALRWRIGVDFADYQQEYPGYVQTPRQDLGVFDEPGIRVIAKLAARIHDDPVTMFAIASLITVGLTVYTIYRNAANLPLALLLYVLVGSWQGSFNGIRQYLACAILFAGHKFILERRFRWWVLVVVVAMLFHISALVMLLAYWIPRRQLRLPAVVVLLVAAAVAVNFYGYFVDVVSAVKDEEITGSYLTEEVSPLRILAAFAPSIVYLAFTIKDEMSEKGHFYANIMFINGVILLSAAGSAYVARFSFYSGVFIAVALPEMIRTRDRSLRSVIVLAAIAFYTVFWYFETSPISALNPYRSVFGR